MSVIGRLGRIPIARAVRKHLGQRLDWLRPRPKWPTGEDYGRRILSEAEGNTAIGRMIETGAPFAALRLGRSELDTMNYYLRERRGGARWKDTQICSNAGFFPADDGLLDEFAQLFLADIGEADFMGVWFIVGEDRIAREYCPDAELMPPRSLEPYYHSEPWSRALGGRRVLVIHPFAESIREQYEAKRERLFRDPNVLPLFELRTVKAVQSIAGEPTGFSNWFDALDSMKTQMDAIDYDVLIVGAGAYGLPLAAHAKRSGRQAIHMGGATQILFGIKGRRWDEHEVISKLYNDAWVRPKASEVPLGAATVEGGCYW